MGHECIFRKIDTRSVRMQMLDDGIQHAFSDSTSEQRYTFSRLMPKL